MEKDRDDVTPKNKKSRARWVLPIFIGIIFGLVIMFNLYPMLSEEEEESTKSSEETTEEKDETKNETTDERVELDVSTQITDIVDNVSPTVVGVTNIQTRDDIWMDDEDDEAGTGSGVIYKKDGDYAYIVTNNHVVEQADAVEVILHDDTSLEAEILGLDLFTDLAVLRVPGDDITEVVEMGSSESLKV